MFDPASSLNTNNKPSKTYKISYSLKLDTDNCIVVLPLTSYIITENRGQESSIRSTYTTCFYYGDCQNKLENLLNDPFVKLEVDAKDNGILAFQYDLGIDDGVHVVTLRSFEINKKQIEKLVKNDKDKTFELIKHIVNLGMCQVENYYNIKLAEINAKRDSLEMITVELRLDSGNTSLVYNPELREYWRDKRSIIKSRPDIIYKQVLKSELSNLNEELERERVENQIDRQMRALDTLAKENPKPLIRLNMS